MLSRCLSLCRKSAQIIVCNERVTVDRQQNYGLGIVSQQLSFFVWLDDFNDAPSVIALLFFGMGVSTLVYPQIIFDSFAVNGLMDVDFRNEVRAVYGGYGVVVAVLLYTGTPN